MVVVGGGIIGLACARSLARGGVDVTLVEAGSALAQASTARANGGVRAQFATTGNIAFSLHSIGVYEELAARRPEVAFHQTGYLLMTGTDEGERGLRSAMERQRSLSVDVEWLAADQVMDRAPMVRADDLRGATFHARDGFLDPAGAAAALAADARAAGARVLTGARVDAIARDGSRWRIAHAHGTDAPQIVVNATGVDARHIAEAAGGVDLPVEPVRRNLAMFNDEPGALTPMMVDLDTGVLVRREVAGGWVGAYSDPADPPGRDITLDPRFLEQLGERAPHRFPFLAELPVDPARCWAGLYPETPDHHAIVGADPIIPGLLHAVGFGGHGVMHAPAAGHAIAELVMTGRCESFDLAPLRPSRFAEDDLTVETSVF